MSEIQPQRRDDDLWIDRIRNALRDLEFGSIQITVHDSKIMQIERTEKLRYPLERTNFAEERSPRRKSK
ncbi:YezD family protein [Effusibacillus consociatus]|uniref:YezD family protein n=1 Tax=Effusibacillus consociatus TaxID=1117041 RepID=A0ABV9PYZ5_9BACL